MPEPLRILLVEDDEDDYVLTRGLLDDAYGAGYTLDWAEDVPSALAARAGSEHDIYLFDDRLGRYDGRTLVREVMADGGRDTPIIFLTGEDNREADLNVMNAGATDYLLKPDLTSAALERSIRYAIKQKKAEARAEYQAYHDPLTGLPNRALLMDRLEQALSRSRRHGHKGALLFIDLDQFKTVNDALGHSVGDRLLQTVAESMRGQTRDEDTVARLGGDEFVLLLPELSNDGRVASGAAMVVAEKVRRALSTTVQLDAHTLHVTPSIGVATFPGERSDAGEVLKQADMAMYQAKTAGRDTIRAFLPEMSEAAGAHLRLNNDLRRALANDELELYFQPQVSVAAGEVVGAEALIRWSHPERGLVLPGEFIPAAEESGLILPIGELVLRAVCAHLGDWETVPRIAVNVSGRQFRQPHFVGLVRSIVSEAGVAPDRLELELTESALIDDVDDAIAKILALKEIGVRFALDDFGVGYSSLSYLRRLPVDVVKIDRSFILDIDTDPETAAFAKHIIGICRHLGREVVAEGVETESIRDFLVDQAVETYQGYFFAAAMPAGHFIDEFTRLLEARENDAAAPRQRVAGA